MKVNRLKPWIAKIAIDGKTQYLGHYATEEEAARVFDVKAAKHGRKLNFPDEWEDVEDIEEEEDEDEDDDDDDDEQEGEYHEVLRPKGKRKRFSSKYRGVFRHKDNRSKPWRAHICIDGKKQYLGYYAKEEEAARAHDAKAAKYGRELNFPDEWEDVKDIEEEDVEEEEEEEEDDDDEDHEILRPKGKRKEVLPQISRCVQTQRLQIEALASEDPY